MKSVNSVKLSVKKHECDRVRFSVLLQSCEGILIMLHPESLHQSDSLLRHASESPQRNKKQMLGKQTIRSHWAHPVLRATELSRGFLWWTPISQCFLLKIFLLGFSLYPKWSSLSSFNFLTFSLSISTLLLSLCVTRPIWAVWWSWEHRSLSGELSGALLKTQRTDYCSCQSH